MYLYTHIISHLQAVNVKFLLTYSEIRYKNFICYKLFVYIYLAGEKKSAALFVQRIIYQFELDAADAFAGSVVPSLAVFITFTLGAVGFATAHTLL